MINKSKWLVLTAVIMLVFGLSAGAAGAKEANNNADGLKVKHISAPAVANKILKEAGIKHHYGTGSEGGNYISDVARHMENGTDFDGISKENAEAYKFAIAVFLNQYELVDEFSVDSKVYSGTISSVVTEVYSDYIIKVDGTWMNNRTPLADAVDAEYTSQDAWASFLPGPSGYDEGLLDLQVNEAFVDWGPYSSAHEYQLNFVGTGEAVDLRVFEGDVASKELNKDWYSDNNGILNVKIYKVN
jgi:hypothetical protein